mmetsp:Transcript_22780/g.53167  ORF Transcript_22780/g.53167 Transcript_22780/m.53167 type:complete len:101 (+) Transcript_22780:113-415(+)|eukprot:CAMPEP_0178430662 /NCGR_PEP_ID=MMETSP0689_2-20121128/31438_1 /TAXON_ID=160604 /ORGANISM="Amphidinium massartii, Strain CS-259" /LENGTH=100 /DNA_ID=CAMNT_0020052531 /DNA_START=94 /DNA_END=396 /DNA_ORIENTATION=-
MALRALVILSALFAVAVSEQTGAVGLVDAGERTEVAPKTFLGKEEASEHVEQAAPQYVSEVLAAKANEYEKTSTTAEVLAGLFSCIVIVICVIELKLLCK